MSASAMLWSSSPSAMGRASSPLNPNSHTPSRHQPPSSSPQTSPTPAGHSFQSFGFALGSPPTKDRATSSSFSSLASASSSFGSSGLRYPRPSQTRRVPTSSSYASARKGKQVDLFGHNDIYGPSASMDGVGGAIGDQVSPVEGAMWKERFDRRIKDRERRQRVREMDIGRRRGFDPTRDGISEEELDQQAQADDEEIFRRLMVMQRRKAQSAQLIAHERELGGSDPAMPEFWEDEPLYEEAEGDPPQDQDQHMASSPIRPFNNGSIRTSTPIRGKNISSDFIGTDMRHRVDPIEEEDRWAMEAAEAEEAEREAEEAAVAQRLEMAYGLSVPRVDKELDDMEWDDFDAMDIE